MCRALPKIVTILTNLLGLPYVGFIQLFLGMIMTANTVIELLEFKGISHVIFFQPPHFMTVDRNILSTDQTESIIMHLYHNTNTNLLSTWAQQGDEPENNHQVIVLLLKRYINVLFSILGCSQTSLERVREPDLDEKEAEKTNWTLWDYWIGLCTVTTQAL